jgi:dTDP-4-dehydrorhamnose reductase
MHIRKKRVLLLGATGMLGSAVYGVLKDKYELVLTVRNPQKLALLERAYGGTSQHSVIEFDAEKLYQDFLSKKGYRGQCLASFLESVGAIDYAINAIGITIPFSLQSPPLTFFINSAFPHILANVFERELIHITTDCVFNGKEGFPYKENSPPTPVDLYGLSKSLGEPANCLTLRTSIIGRELDGHSGLLEWYLRQGGNIVTGFSGHFWNGITTKQFGEICDRIMEDPAALPATGKYHVFSGPVSKYDMLVAFERKYHVGAKIQEDTENKLNRTLGTVYDFNSRLNIPPFEDMLNDL